MSDQLRCPLCRQHVEALAYQDAQGLPTGDRYLEHHRIGVTGRRSRVSDDGYHATALFGVACPLGGAFLHDVDPEVP